MHRPRHFRPVPSYTDVSHFRAPYENVVLSGFGQESALAMLGEHIEQGPEGRNLWAPHMATRIRSILPTFSVVELGENAVQLKPHAAGDPVTAQMWVARRLKEGNVVLASASVVNPALGPGQLLALDPREPETVDKAAGLMPILATPTVLDRVGLLGLAAVVVVGVWWWSSSKGK